MFIQKRTATTAGHKILKKISPAANNFSKSFPTGRSRKRVDSEPLIGVF
jgi:hypothetical protein